MNYAALVKAISPGQGCLVDIRVPTLIVSGWNSKAVVDTARLGLILKVSGYPLIPRDWCARNIHEPAQPIIALRGEASVPVSVRLVGWVGLNNHFTDAERHQQE